MEVEYSKELGRNDIRDRLGVPIGWMNILLPQFRDDENEARIGASCHGYFWEFRCAIRSRRGGNASLQPKEWMEFIRFAGIQEGDMFILQKKENHFRGTNYNIRVQRKDADSRWDHVPPPARDAPIFHQFNI